MTNNEATILRRIAVVHQDSIAKQTGLSTSQINRIVAGENGIKLTHLDKFLSAIGMSIVEANSNTVSVEKKEWEAIRILAAKYLEQQTAGEDGNG